MNIYYLKKWRKAHRKHYRIVKIHKGNYKLETSRRPDPNWKDWYSKTWTLVWEVPTLDIILNLQRKCEHRYLEKQLLEKTNKRKIIIPIK